MSKLPPNELRERINEDDGAPDDTVYVKVSTKSKEHYHNDPACSRLKGRSTDDLNDIDRAEAQRRSLGPCRFCTIPRNHHTTDPYKYHRKYGFLVSQRNE